MLGDLQYTLRHKNKPVYRSVRDKYYKDHKVMAYKDFF